jgi:arylsulfatase A-like enzyme
LAALEDAGLSDNTLVIFTSDNGGANYVGFEGINAPYRGWKATFFEGGVHVPYMLRWPARIPAGVRAEVDAASIDIFATIAAAAGAVQSEIVDGIDLTPILRGETPAPARPLFWRAGEYRAVLHEGWKLQIAQRPAATWLFNLHSDPTERTNLAAVEPERVAALRALLDQQDRLAAHPLWPALVEAPILIDAPANAATAPEAEYVYWGN